jgi:Ca2+-binding RTX toxin-like protein
VQPDDDYHGAVTLNYLVGDGINTTAAALSFNLAAVNDAPELTGIPAALPDGTEDTDYMVQAADLLAGWTDVEGDTLGITGLSADHGSVVDHGDGSYTVQPESDYHGAVTLNYLVDDGTGTTAAALSFNLADINHSPVLVAPLADQAVQYDALDWSYDAGMLFSDQDITDSLSYSAMLANGDPLPAWMQIGAASGLITGTPEFGDRGTYALSIMAADSYGSSISAPLTVAVTVFDAGQLLVSTMGDDLLAGDQPNVTASYAYSNAPVFVSLAISIQQDTVGGGLDTLSDVDNLMGSDFNDKLTGSAGANILDGGSGADQLIGGDGNDTYVVDNASDVVTETGTGGTDTILSWVNFANLALVWKT